MAENPTVRFISRSRPSSQTGRAEWKVVAVAEVAKAMAVTQRKSGASMQGDTTYRAYRSYRTYVLELEVMKLLECGGRAGRNSTGEYFMARDDGVGFLPKHGNYQALLAFRKSEVVYDLTRVFCARFLRRGDRTVDQMVQAARSGKQNIVEGSKASKTSKEMEIKLMNVARASLEELLVDYGDYLRTQRATVWDKDSREARYVRRLGMNPELKFEDIRELTETRAGPVVANMALCFVHQANYLLDRLIWRLEVDFVKEGGLRERMTKARIDYRRAEKK
ncbi:four helix bundle suffix domain-containing protein [Oleiharenicola lentus]|uniref:four helix bundle suffix domain-containing protein n=1 Tax=Oleiharenicola lentus TaxID=2508720 RepID=UPI003F6755B7